MFIYFCAFQACKRTKKYINNTSRSKNICILFPYFVKINIEYKKEHLFINFNLALTWNIDVYRYADSSLIFGPFTSNSVSVKPDDVANFFNNQNKTNDNLKFI